jgi:hypothetical protein
VNELIHNLAQFVQPYDSGPSLYFHRAALGRLLTHSAPSEALGDDHFLEYLYAVLTSWGMHRSGERGPKLADFAKFKRSLKSQAEQLDKLKRLSLGDIKADELSRVIEKVWGVISNLRIGRSTSTVVVGSKALSHVLPELVPPIDRRYTFKFFYDSGTVSQGDHVAFGEVMGQFRAIALSCKANILEICQKSTRDDMNTGSLKVIDNAIIGYIRRA